jgi:hypothetical protein
MRAPVVFFSLVSSAALALGACSVEERNYNTADPAGTGGGAGAGEGGSAGGGGAGGAQIGIQEACSTYAAAICSRQTECVPFVTEVFYGEEPVCSARFEIYCSAFAKAPGTSWTPDGILTCASAVVNASCGELVKGILRGSLPECQPPPGALADGAPCIDSGQCQNGYCNNDELDQCGVCTGFAGEGVECNTFQDCKLGLTCDLTIGKCVVAGSEGAACAPGQTLCEPPLVCHNGTCGAGAMLGEMCDPMFSACAFPKGHYCDPQTNSCNAFGMAKDFENCGYIMGTSFQCAASGTCSFGAAASKCIPHASDGAACDLQKGIGCMPPAICFNGVCTPPAPDACGP